MGPNPYIYDMLATDRERMVQAELLRRTWLDALAQAQPAASSPDRASASAPALRRSRIGSLRVVRLLMRTCTLRLQTTMRPRGNPALDC